MKVEELLRAVDGYFDAAAYPAEPERLYVPIKYGLEAGGKRLRPMFVLLSYGLFGGDYAAVMPCAAAVEVFHNFTLLHDDIMDHAPMRRGRESVVKHWGENIAILSGDAMMIRSYTLLAEAPRELLPDILRCFNRFALQVCEGQQYDMDFEQRQTVSEQEYIDMIRLKTAVLFEGAVEIGAILGCADRKAITLLREFAEEFGLAFQLQDDLLDSYGDSRLGKNVGGDILEGKKTYLMISALNDASDEDRQVLLNIHNQDIADGEKIRRTLAMFDKYGVCRKAEAEIDRRFSKAISALNSVECNQDNLAEMRGFVEGLMRRSK